MSASQYPVSLVRWGSTAIPYRLAAQMADDAEAIAQGYSLLTQVRRDVEGEPQFETIVNYFELARLLERILQKVDQC